MVRQQSRARQTLLHGTLQQRASDPHPSSENGRNPFREGEFLLAMSGTGTRSLLREASWSRTQSNSLWYCISHAPSLFTTVLFGTKLLLCKWGTTKMQWWDTWRGKGQPQNAINGMERSLNWCHPPAGLAHPVIQSKCSRVQNSPSPFGYIHSTPPRYSRLIQLSLPTTNFNCVCCFTLVLRSICVCLFSSKVVVFTN